MDSKARVLFLIVDLVDGRRAMMEVDLILASILVADEDPAAAEAALAGGANAAESTADVEPVLAEAAPADVVAVVNTAQATAEP